MNNDSNKDYYKFSLIYIILIISFICPVNSLPENFKTPTRADLSDLSLTHEDIISGIDYINPDAVVWPTYYNITIHNIGTINISHIEVNIYVGNPAWKWILTKKLIINEIGSGNNYYVNVSKFPSSEYEQGSAYVKVLIDPNNNITESNENNNEAMINRKENVSYLSNLFFRTRTSDDAKISIINKGPLYEGEKCLITTEIGHIGHSFVDALNISVSIYIDDTLFDTITIDYLHATLDEIIINTTWIATLGNHSIKVIIDENNTIEESNEFDNEAFIMIKVRQKTFIEAYGILLFSIIIIIIFNIGFIRFIMKRKKKIQ